MSFFGPGQGVGRTGDGIGLAWRRDAPTAEEPEPPPRGKAKKRVSIYYVPCAWPKIARAGPTTHIFDGDDVSAADATATAAAAAVGQ